MKKSSKSAIVILCLLLIFIVILIVGLFKKDKQDTQVDTKDTTQSQTETQTEVSREGMMHSYLTGEWVDKEIGLRRPIAIMLNNIKAGVPQVGISKASIVYEAPVEGGICRLLAIFEDYDDLDKIGSVRSARTYYVYLAAEFEPIFLHYGEPYYADDALKNTKISNLSGTEGIGKTVYYRTTDRVSPHNAFTSAENIQAGVEEMNYETQASSSYQSHFQFTEDKVENNLEQGNVALTIYPGYKINNPWFVYNSQDKLYYRYQYEDIQIDEMTGKQIAYKNVILQFCKYSFYDNTGYLNIDVNSSGTGKYITNGKSIDISWKKDDDTEITHYYDLNGSEIVLNQGKTWICIIQNDKISNVQILDTLE